MTAVGVGPQPGSGLLRGLHGSAETFAWAWVRCYRANHAGVLGKRQKRNGTARQGIRGRPPWRAAICDSDGHRA